MGAYEERTSFSSLWGRHQTTKKQRAVLYGKRAQRVCKNRHAGGGIIPCIRSPEQTSHPKPCKPMSSSWDAQGFRVCGLWSLGIYGDYKDIVGVAIRTSTASTT